eukprot:4364113-Pleurochrysis_carterae.AAC.6
MAEASLLEVEKGAACQKACCSCSAELRVTSTRTPWPVFDQTCLASDPMREPKGWPSSAAVDVATNFALNVNRIIHLSLRCKTGFPASPVPTMLHPPPLFSVIAGTIASNKGA